MKLFHLSDLHIGKRVNEVSMLEDQKHILCQMVELVKEHRPDALLIAGDVYDKTVPSAEAVELLDDFLVQLAKLNLPVFIVSGNHDSPERLSFASRLIDQSGIHISRVYDGSLSVFTLQDEFGPVNICLMPFVKPAVVRHVHPEENIGTYSDALRVALGTIQIDTSARNVLVAHQFVTGDGGGETVLRSDSEDLSIGGLDNVDASLFADFDYVALGHIHAPQNIKGYPHVRYCGSPLKYSFSEINQQKSLTQVVLNEKGNLNVTTIPLQPLHDMREIRGTYEELTAQQCYQGTPTDDYLRVILTDETEVLEARNRLRVVYPNIMNLEYDNARTRANQQPITAAALQSDPLELFSSFFEQSNGKEMTIEQSQIVTEMIQTIWEKK